jgi:type II secretory pathway pseudopilin PulG
VTLFEALAALTIVGVTSVSALAAVGSELRTAERARRAIESDALVAQRIDFMGLLTDAELQALPDTVKQGHFDAPLDDYRWVTTSAPLSDQAGIYDVSVKITWPGSSHTVRTWLYRRPPLVTR